MYAIIYDKYGNIYDAKCLAAFETRKEARQDLRRRVLEDIVDNTKVTIDRHEEETEDENGDLVTVTTTDVFMESPFDEDDGYDVTGEADISFTPRGCEDAAYKIVRIPEPNTNGRRA